MPLLNKSLRAGTQRKIGDKVYGAPGGSRISWQFVLSYEVAEQLAAQTNLSVEHAHRYLIAMGRVMQGMLLKGQPVGIPHLGCLYLKESYARITSKGFRKGAKLRRHRSVKMHVPKPLGALISASAVYTGPLPDKVKAAREKNRRRLRHHKRDKNDGLKHTQEGPIMEPNAPKAPKTKPGLMVEDADSFVDTNAEGRQTIQKTPDRKVEAERRGVDESKL